MISIRKADFVSLTYKNLKGRFIMFKLFKLLFVGKTISAFIDISASDSDTMEKKKCQNCLRRINIDYVRCPFCDSSKFCVD
jgi:hypothetical protein